MVNVYKINLFTYSVEDDNHDTSHYKDYCLKQNILGWGWRRGSNAKPVYSLAEYKNDYGKSRSLSRACNQIRNMKEGDYCWTHIGDKWYLGKVKGDFHFHAPDNYPAFGMFHDCVWKPIDNADLVPGLVVTHSRNDGTIRCLAEDNDFSEYCELLYNGNNKETMKLNFWHLTHYEDLEDIVGLYLQKEKGYLVFPSTNKQGTKDYEYKLVQNFGSNKHAVIQCKNNNTISEDVWDKFEKGEEYKDLQVFILTIKEDSHPEQNNYKKLDNGIFKYSFENGRINVFNNEELKKWAKDNINILPTRIQKYLEISE